VQTPPVFLKKMMMGIKKICRFSLKKMQFGYCLSSSFVDFMENYKSHYYFSIPVVLEKLSRFYEKKII